MRGKDQALKESAMHRSREAPSAGSLRQEGLGFIWKTQLAQRAEGGEPGWNYRRSGQSGALPCHRVPVGSRKDWLMSCAEGFYKQEKNM